MNDGRLMAIDMRLVDAEAEDHPDSKVNHLVAECVKDRSRKPESYATHILSNLGVAKNQKTGHSVFDDIVAKISKGESRKSGLPTFQIFRIKNAKKRLKN